LRVLASIFFLILALFPTRKGKEKSAFDVTILSVSVSVSVSVCIHLPSLNSRTSLMMFRTFGLKIMLFYVTQTAIACCSETSNKIMAKSGNC
jgi:hypothetical protein